MASIEIAGGAKGGLWNFNTANIDTSTAPVKGRFRTNTGTYRNATQIAIHGTTIQEINRADTLRTLLVDDIIQFQDSLISAAWCRYVLQSPPIDNGAWFQLNVALEADGNVKSGDNQEVIVLFTANSNAIAVPVYAESIAYLQTTTQMVGALDSKPQQTDGIQLLSASITPKRAANKLRIRSTIPFSSNNQLGAWFALFQDAIAPAIHAAVVYAPGKNFGTVAALDVDIAAGTTSATTIKLRCGNLPGSNQTLAICGSPTNRWLGGASRVTLSIMEHV
jgi:hypothetical protein